jgi:hypothetical protein
MAIPILITAGAASIATKTIVRSLVFVLLTSGVGWSPPNRDPVHHVTFLCPLCRELGRTVTLRAELDATPTVTDLQGGCVHAAAFGELGQTLK